MRTRKPIQATKVVAVLAALLLLLLLLLGQARAEEPVPGGSRTAVGGEIDLLPVVLSAAAGKLGGGANLWIGRDRLRARAVATYVAFPPGALTPPGFEDRELTVAAGIVDVFFRPGFAGPWLGGGLEYWWNRIASPAGPGTASWSSGVVTLGAGYVWKFWRSVYLNPWGAGHLLLSKPEVTLHGATWKPPPLAGEVSLKIGCEF
jgi:hypothetical protein